MYLTALRLSIGTNIMSPRRGAQPVRRVMRVEAHTKASSVVHAIQPSCTHPPLPPIDELLEDACVVLGRVEGRQAADWP